jgi:hypothetical protein
MMEKLEAWWLAGETEVLGENLSQCHFVHHKSHITWQGANPSRCGGKPAANRLSYATALYLIKFQDVWGTGDIAPYIPNSALNEGDWSD